MPMPWWSEGVSRVAVAADHARRRARRARSGCRGGRSRRRRRPSRRSGSGRRPAAACPARRCRPACEPASPRPQVRDPVAAARSTVRSSMSKPAPTTTSRSDRRGQQREVTARRSRRREGAVVGVAPEQPQVDRRADGSDRCRSASAIGTRRAAQVDVGLLTPTPRPGAAAERQGRPGRLAPAARWRPLGDEVEHRPCRVQGHDRRPRRGRYQPGPQPRSAHRAASPLGRPRTARARSSCACVHRQRRTRSSQPRWPRTTPTMGSVPTGSAGAEAPTAASAPAAAGEATAEPATRRA